jgi:hypothetical protein
MTNWFPTSKQKKGLRQGDPMSPILFNIVADNMLAILIARAKEAGHVEGIIPHLIQDGLSIVQYADDTVIFMSHDVQKAVNMKLILTTFEKLSGLKINYQKSKIFVLVRRKNMRTTIPTYLAVIQANSLFVILAC